LSPTPKIRDELFAVILASTSSLRRRLLGLVSSRDSGLFNDVEV
jgi:predicted house-cleaning NTP pyrophosphatase (Maf/HAM1 superfamily)